MRNDELRRRCVTASEMPAIVGLDAFGRTPMTVYLDKMGLTEPQEETEAMALGTLFESALLQLWGQRKPATILLYDTRQHPTVPVLAGTPDALGVEIKTVGWSHLPHWAQGVPLYVTVQVACYMAIFDQPSWDVAMFAFPTRRFTIQTVERDVELEGMLIEEAQRFHRDHLLPQHPPPLDGSPGCEQYLRRRYDQTTDVLREADDEMERLAQEYFAARQVRDAQQAVMDTRKNLLMAAIGEDAGVQGHNWRITWKRSKSSLKTDWKALADTFEPTVTQIQAFTKEVPGARRFLAKQQDEKEE